MKRFLALALLAMPLTASAANPRLLRFPTIRTQVSQVAKANGFLGKGQGETLHIKTLAKPTMGKPGKLAVTINGVGGFTGAQGNIRLATATFKTTQFVDGQLAQGVKQGGQIFQHIEY